MSAPAVTILLAPAAAGKTEAALKALAAPRRGRALLLLPGALHRLRLAPRFAGLPRLRAGTFERIATVLLRRAGERPELVSERLRAALLRAELRALVAAGRLPRFASVAHKAGFVAEALRLIDELQACELPPAQLAGAGVSVYDGELATIYAAYGAALARRGLVDRDGLIVRARRLVEARPELTRDLELLVVDGFDQFAPLQLGLLVALAGRAARTLITLTGDGAGRPAHRRFIRTLDDLRGAFPQARVELLGPAGASRKHPALAQIERNLFAGEAPRMLDAGGAVALIAAPDREREVRAALRHARSLLAAGALPEEVALLYRGGEQYPPLVREVAAEYGLPVAVFEGMPLGSAPPIIALLALLALPLDAVSGPAAARPSTRRALVECWRALGSTPTSIVGADTPLLPDFATAALLLDRATRAGSVAHGLPRLRAALAELAAEPPIVPDPIEAEERPFAGPPVTPDEAAQLLALLDAFMAWVTPPAEATPAEYVEWVRGLLGWLDDPGATADDGSPAAEEEPPAVAERFPFTPEQRALLRRALAERERAARLLEEGPLPYGLFLAELAAALDEIRYGGQDPAPGKLAVLPILAARGATYAHVLILGAAEGELPASLPAPPFYTRRERALLAERGAAPPPADPADERSLFYEAVTRARESLTFAYTRLDESGNELRSSPYLRAVAALFEQPLPTREIRAGSAPELAEAASAQEQLVALAANDPELATLPPDAPLALANHVRRAAAVERQREGHGPYGPYEGLIEDPDVRAELARRFGPGHRWSATQINDYTICPYRFAAAHLLRIGPRGDPEAALEQAGRGQLFHAILAEAGRHWARLGLPFDASSEAPILAALDAAADKVLAAAPQTYGFEPGPFWAWEQAEARAALRRAVRRWLRDARGWEGFRPAGVEASFGMGAGQPPLRLQTPAGEALVVGRIDRVDQDDQGRLALVDYKSGGTPKPLVETTDGWDVQLTLYCLAAEQIGGRGQQVAQAAQLMIGSGRRGKALTAAERPRAEEALRERLGAAIAGSRGGAFVVRPSRDCPSGCAFMPICRVNLRKRSD